MKQENVLLGAVTRTILPNERSVGLMHVTSRRRDGHTDGITLATMRTTSAYRPASIFFMTRSICSRAS